MTLRFDYWNTVDPSTFLADDWDNDARAWAGLEVARAIDLGARTMVEVGPGPGVDYIRQFRPIVESGQIDYTAWEGSHNLADALRARGVPDVVCRPLLDLPAASFDVVYAKAVLEHQPTLEPSLGKLLAAARATALINWYRPPALNEIHEEIDGVHYWTFSRADVRTSVKRAGFVLEDVNATFSSGNECWRLVRQSAVDS